LIASGIKLSATNLLALSITAAAVVLAVLALLAVALVTQMEALLPASPLLAAILKIMSCIVLVGLAAGAAALLYRYGPSRDRAQWDWLSPGSLLFAVGWVALTLGFGSYVANFGNYSATYGSLATAVVLLT
jgi:membrane protein